MHVTSASRSHASTCESHALTPSQNAFIQENSLAYNIDSDEYNVLFFFEIVLIKRAAT